ncbi:MAG: type II toxin-antitoxin system RelE/ParE family toxin [Dechloromonas sp.]|nr:type II toxin-antitoxin system RelE/ParE family toxin [Dechloromonas sp.]
MAKVTFSPKSRQDHLDIGDHLAKDSRENSRRFIGKLTEQCQRIGISPMGYVGREDLARGLRMAASGRYVIFFRLIDDIVRIERVLLGARNLPVVLEDSNTQNRVVLLAQLQPRTESGRTSER